MQHVMSKGVLSNGKMVKTVFWKTVKWGKPYYSLDNENWFQTKRECRIHALENYHITVNYEGILTFQRKG